MFINWLYGLKGRMRRGRRTKVRRRRPRVYRLGCSETLETRTLLSAGSILLDLQTGTVSITGTEQADVATVSVNDSGQMLVRLETTAGTQEQVFDPAQVAAIGFQGLDGDDAFRNLTNVAVTASGGAGNDFIIGGAAGDVLSGGAGADQIVGGGGDDTLAGGGENDSLYGSQGDDQLDGGEGNDYLSGGPDHDVLNGQAGDDELRDGPGGDSLTGGEGVDTLYGLAGNNTLADDGADTLVTWSTQNASSPSHGTGEESTDSLTANQIQAIRDGLDEVLGWADSIADSFPVGGEKVGPILKDALDRGLVQPVGEYLDNTPNPTVEGLVNVLKGLSGTSPEGDLIVIVDEESVRGVLDGNTIRFDLHFEATRTKNTTLDKSIFGLADADGSVEVGFTGRVDFNFSFGIDLAVNSVVPKDMFFIQVGPTSLLVGGEINAEDLDFDLNVGFLGAQARDAWVRLNAQAALTIEDPDADGRIRVAEFSSAHPDVQMSGSLHVEVPVHAELANLADDGVISIIHDDLSAGGAPEVRLDGFETFKDFKTVSREVVAQILTRLRTEFEKMGQTAAMRKPFPFAKNLKLTQAADFADAFSSALLDYLTADDGKAGFGNVQQFIDELADAMGVDPEAVDVQYDPATKELTFAIDVEHVKSGSVSLALEAEWERLAEVEITSDQPGGPQLEWTSTINAGFDFGIRLSTTDANGAELSILDRFFVRNASFEAHVTANVPDVDGTARLKDGVFEFELVNGTGSADVTVSVAVSGLEDGFSSATFTPAIAGSANITAPVVLTADVGGVELPAETTAVVEWTDITDATTLTARLEPAPDLASLLDALEKVAMQHVVDGLKQVVEFLQQVQNGGVFQQKIPVINKSLAELLDTADRLDALHRELEENPPATIDEALQRINVLLGENGTTVSYEGGVLGLDFVYGFEKTHQLDLGFELDAALNAGAVEEFVDVNGSAPATLTIGGTATLGLAIDVSDPLAPLFYIKDSSRIELAGLIDSNDIEFEASVVSLGVYIRDGVVHLDNGAVGQPATWTFSLVPGDPNGRHRISDVIADIPGSIDTVVDGRMEVDLPVYFPTPNSHQGNIRVTVADLGDIANTTDLDEAALPDFAEALSNLDLDDVIDMAIDGLDRLFRLIEERFEGRELPLIGDRLDEAAGFLKAVREKVIARLQETADLADDDTIRAKIYEALGPTSQGGLGWLGDRSGDGQVTEDDVEVNFSLAEKRAEVLFILAGSYELGSPLEFDVGLDGLGLEVDADLNLDVGFTFDVGFGVSVDEGFYFLSGAGEDEPELKVFLDATISEPIADPATWDPAAATGELFFLQLDVTDKQVTRGDGSSSGSYFLGEFTVDVKDPGTGLDQDGRLTLAEMASAASVEDVLDPRLAATAHVSLEVITSVEGDARFPRLGADFELLWQFDTADPEMNGSISQLGFNDVRLHMGELVNNMVVPVLEKVNEVLEPIRPVAAALDTPLPVISDLMGEDYTLLDLARDMGQISDGTYKFIETVSEFADFVEGVRNFLNGLLEPGSDGWLHFDDLELDGNLARQAGNLGKLQPVAPPNTGLDEADQQSIKDFEDQKGFAVPFLKNPGELFGLLLGKDILLVTYDMPRLDFNFQYDQFFPIIGPLGASLSGEIGAVADFKFGLDSSGLRQYVEGGYEDPELILNGLYVSDTVNADGTGADVPELELYGGIRAFAAVSGGVGEFGVGGGVKAEVFIDLNDPDADGRVYFQEIVGAFHNTATLRRLVNISGELSGVLSAYVEVAFVRHEFDLAEVKLLDFSVLPPGDEPTPVLGELDEATGELRLNMGARAGERLYHDETADGDEHFAITAGANAGDVVVTLYGEHGTWEQAFSGVNRIVADGGEGDDTITVDPAVAAAVEFRGGAGNDTLQAGGGQALLVGGEGNDHLTATVGSAVLDGGNGHDVLAGGDAADVLDGGAGNDALSGGSGADSIDGGDGNDILHGDAGNDTLVGGTGHDQLNGGADADSLSGGRGRDTLAGGAGDDILSGGRDDDSLSGGAGDDDLAGDEGDDLLDGGDDADTLNGGTGSDSLFGAAAIDALFGGLGMDWLYGGLGNDVVHGGAGADRLEGGDGNDALYGDAGVDALFGQGGLDFLSGGMGQDELSGGEGDDTLQGDAGNDALFGYGWVMNDYGQKVGNNGVADGNDLMAGGEGDDTLYGGQGADQLRGDEGSDLIDGQSGEDRIQYAIDLVDPAGVDDLSGGPHRDAIEVLGTETDDVLRVQQMSPTTFVVDRIHPVTGDVLASFQFALPADPADRDIELLRVSGLGGDDVIRAVGTFNVNQLVIDGGAGNDWIEGSAGTDLIFGGTGSDTIFGGAGGDELHGGGEADELHGGDGNDAVYGEAGDDTLDGGQGVDVLHGGADSDLLMAGPGILGDIMFGDDDSGASAGDDTLIGGDGVDVMFGGAGNDRLEGRGLSDILHGEAGDDTLVGGAGRDFLDGGADADELYAMTDDGAVEPTAPQFEWTQVYWALDARESEIMGTPEAPGELPVIEQQIDDLAARVAELQQQDPNHPAIPELQAEAARLEQRRDDLANELAVINLQQIDLVPYQSVFVDILIGGADDDLLRGSDHGDRLIGGSGNDTIQHSAGDDVVFGGTDPIEGQTTDGQSELDQYVIFGTEADDTIVVGLDAGDGTSNPQVVVNVNGVASVASHLEIEVVGVEALAGNDTVTVQFGQNAAMKVEIDGGTGNDTIDASTFQDDATLRGGDGDDTLFAGLGNDRLEGGDGSDLLVGGEGLDSLYGGAGNDTLSGGAEGGETIDGGEGIDRLYESRPTLADATSPLDREFVVSVGIISTLLVESYGGATFIDPLAGIEQVHLETGAGNDTLSVGGFSGDATLVGGAGDDTITGGGGNDSIDGGAGHDAITGGAGNDSIDGGDGNDTITGGAGDDVLAGGLGSNRLVEAANVSFVLTDAQLAGLGVDVLSGFQAAELTGGLGYNHIDASGFSYAATLIGGAGNDTLIGGSGHDDIRGGEGNDSLVGGAGNDLLNGEAGYDTIYGGYGHDTLYGGMENDWLDGDADNDSVDGQSGDDTVYGDSGDDTLYGGDGFDVLAGHAGRDYLHGGDENDWLYGGDDDDTLHGGDGSDRLYGENGNDSLYGDPMWRPVFDPRSIQGDDYLNGGAGNDTLVDYAGSDSLYGGSGNDWLSSGSGQDLLDGGYDSDTLYAGSGNDTLYAGYGTAADWLYAEDGNDLLYGQQGTNRLYAGAGDDTLYGGTQTDYMYGESGNDYLSAGYGNDLMDGGDGNDTMYGGYGNDTLYGQSGADYLYGQWDNDYLDGGRDGSRDILYGGYGADTFINYYYVWYDYKNQPRRTYEDVIGDFAWNDTRIDHCYSDPGPDY